MKKIVYLAGLPRSGSTLLSNVLGMHKDIYATPSSPLCSIVQSMRKNWSDDTFLLAQLDDNFDAIHKKLKTSTLAFMQAWSSDTDKPMVVDKNRGWLFCLETLRELDPDFKIIITLRDLRSIYSSIEKKHRKTLFIEFPDHMEHNMVDVRANALFSDGGLVGSILKGLQNIKDIPSILKHIYYWRFEDFIADPKKTTSHLFNYLGVEPAEIDFNNIVQSTHESDSYYRMKYSHKIHPSVIKPEDFNDIPISPRILNEITTRFAWYYQELYPQTSQTQPAQLPNVIETDDMVMIRKLEKAIQDETK
jgi:sulfotransferase